MSVGVGNLFIKLYWGFCILRTLDLYTLYTTIPHDQLKFRIRPLIQFILKEEQRKRFQHLVTGRHQFYFAKNNSKSNNKYKQDEIILMFIFYQQDICHDYLDYWFNKRSTFQLAPIVLHCR
jgi:hypothetical protein